MTADEVIEAAKERTGLSDFGDPAILEGLNVLLKAYAEEAGYNERGSQIAHAELVIQMANRMKVEVWLKDHPELL